MGAKFAALSVVGLSAIFFPGAMHTSRADITGLVVDSTKDIGPFRGKPYREIEAHLNGTAPGGAYSVPVTLAFPKQASDHNRFAIVDIDNTVTIGNDKFVLGGRAVPGARNRLGEDFLFGAGHAHVSVIWDKKAVEALHNGIIGAGADGFTIIADAARLARNPSKYLPAGMGSAPSSDKIIAYGYSQTGGLLREWYLEHHNKQGDALVFDGAVVAEAGGGCYNIEKLGYKDCSRTGGLSDGGKVIAISTETDAQWGADAERGDNPDYRTIEIAGVSHIPAARVDFRDHGHPMQNPADYRPPFRAALVNLEEWINGKEPPPSVAIELADKQLDLGGCCGMIREAVRDADGNALGGMRLPHMTTVLADGRKAGAPLGQYTGFAPGFAKDNVYFTIGGEFKPFSPEKVKALYPTHAAYLDLVRTSAKDLEAKRYILAEDAKAYIDAAEASDVPPKEK